MTNLPGTKVPQESLSPSLCFLIPLSLQIVVLIKLIKFWLMFHKLQIYTVFFFPFVIYFSSSLSSYVLLVLF